MVVRHRCFKFQVRVAGTSRQDITVTRKCTDNKEPLVPAIYSVLPLAPFFPSPSFRRRPRLLPLDCKHHRRHSALHRLPKACSIFVTKKTINFSLKSLQTALKPQQKPAIETQQTRTLKHRITKDPQQGLEPPRNPNGL